jgi:hypothetical protein
MGFPFERLRADDPYGRSMASTRSFLSERPEGALMTPEQSLIALWTALVSCGLAFMAFLFGASTGWIFQLFIFALLIALAEWVYSQ